jgi:hypothetical protein
VVVVVFVVVVVVVGKVEVEQLRTCSCSFGVTRFPFFGNNGSLNILVAKKTTKHEGVSVGWSVGR